MQKYRSEFDGLRAFAIIPVILFHIHPDLFPCGFLGVDVFFVLSGYLITSAILPRIKGVPLERPFSFKEFYFRRIRRLLPASLFLIIVLQLFGALILFTPEWQSLSAQSVSGIAMVANFYYWEHAQDYWGQSADTMPLLHTWSLSVEEQFYLFFPLLLLAASKIKVVRYAPVLTLIIAAILSFGGFIYAIRHFFPAGFYWGIFRAWEILAGSVIAVTQLSLNSEKPRQNTKKIERLLPIIGLCLIGLGYLTGWGSPILDWKNSLLTVTGTCIVINYVNELSLFAWPLLTFPLAVGIGRISYSLYLWHWPAIIFLKLGGLNSWFFVVLITMIFALVSYRFVERPFRLCDNKKFLCSFATLTIATAVSLILPFTIHRPGFLYKKPDFVSNIDLSPSNKNPHYDGFIGSYLTGLSLFRPGGETADVLILGDSHSIMFFPPIQKSCADLGLRLTFFGAQGGTSPFFIEEGSSLLNYSAPGYWTLEQRKEFDFSRLFFIQKNKPKIVFICSRWGNYASWGSERFIRHLKKLKTACGTAKCVFLGQPPELPFGSEGFNSRLLEFPLLRSLPFFTGGANPCDKVHNWLKEFSASNPNFVFQQTEQFFVERNSVIYHEGENMFYFDDDHLSIIGSMRIAPIIKSILRGIANQN